MDEDRVEMLVEISIITTRNIYGTWQWQIWETCYHSDQERTSKLIDRNSDDFYETRQEAEIAALKQKLLLTERPFSTDKHV